MIEMTIESVRASPVNYQRVVILKEASGRYLPIWVGPAEADAIAVKLHEVVLPRPLTHDLLCSVIEDLGGALSFVVVCDLKDDTFYAKLAIQVDGRTLEVDARPSDAMALAVRTKSPIYVEESVLMKAGFIMDKESGKPVPVDVEGNKVALTEEELNRLSAFREFVNTLDMRDFE